MGRLEHGDLLVSEPPASSPARQQMDLSLTKFTQMSLQETLIIVLVLMLGRVISQVDLVRGSIHSLSVTDEIDGEC